jgi:hypothetical protein
MATTTYTSTTQPNQDGTGQTTLYTPSTSAAPATPLAPVTQPITSAALSGSPAFNLSPAVPSTGVDGALGAIKSNTDAFTQSLADAAATSKQNSQDAFQKYLDTITATPGQAELTNQAYSATVDPAQAKLQSVNQQLLDEQNALNHQLVALDQNKEGYFGTGLDEEKQRIKTQSLNRQADLAVIQSAAQGQYDSAKAIADRAVAATVEQNTKLTDALKTNYEDNKDLFSADEQRQFQSLLADRQAATSLAADKEKARYDEIIKQNDPLYQAQVGEAKASTANTYSEIAARKAAANNNTTINGKPQTTVQTQVQGYADRTNQADVILGQLGSKFTSAAAGVGALLPNFLKSSDRQQYEQAQRDFVNAVLRRESGAAISGSEFDSAGKQYFPQPGDSPAVVTQKAANRQTVINNLYQQSNVQRSVLPGQIIEDADGKQYQVGDDGVTLTPL